MGRGASARGHALGASIMELHRRAGNRAVAGLLQRDVGWKTDAPTQGRAWNADETAVGKVRRIPLEGLSEGPGANRSDDRAQRWVWDLRSAQKLHGFCTDAYISAYIELDDAIAQWFRRHKAKLGRWASWLRANYTLEYVDVDHEALMRGSAAGSARASGTGTILAAVRALHPALGTSADTCAPMPAPLSKRYEEAKAAKRKAKPR